MTRLLKSLPAVLACLAALSVAAATRADEPKLVLHKGDKIVIIGNTLAERMQYFGNVETLLQSRFPELELTLRNLGWSADELTLRPRQENFQNHGHRLEDHKPQVVIAAFGFNESFAGPEGLPKFRTDLDNFIKETTSTKYDGKAAPQLVLLSPIAHENLKQRTLPDGKADNANLEIYTKAMAEAATAHKVVFVDLFHPTLKLMASSAKPLTFNGVHLTAYGDEQVAPIIDAGLFGARPAGAKTDLAKLRDAVKEKDLQHFYDYRAVNGCYIYGSRKEPFGVVNFPAEFAKLRKMIRNRDERIWAIAQGKQVPDKIDDSNTGELVKVESNIKEEIKITTPEEALKSFKLPEGYEINLFASEVDFPDLKKPVQMSFDPQGRLWVCTMPSYPMYLPGTPVDDKLLVFEDTNGDGKADKESVFADKLYLPTGFEFADGGVYLASPPNLLFLKDTDGDGKADQREIVLEGFDTADSHHYISAFVLDPGGAMYFEEGTFLHTQVETPHGPTRCKNAAVYRYEPRTQKVDAYVSYGFANPWGHCFDRWGQDFVADASGGANYFAAAFSGDVDYPNKHGGLQQFLKMQWRPTCGCELVSSRNFPENAQGNYLLNNCIGFQGILQYKMREQGSGFAADPIEPLLQSSDSNFRPTDLEFGPDGALYVVDWFNPLIGHMQHALRDPNRDKGHGRIWRIHNKNRPLVEAPKIAGASVGALLELLKAPEDRTRYRAKIELQKHDTDEVMRELASWTSGLDKKDTNYWHNMLEALWVHQYFDVVDAGLLKQMLRCPEPKARAASTRVLCYWRDRVDGALPLLKTQAGDDHPRVRLEAVRAASFFKGKDVPKAQEVALESLLKDQDEYLKYTFNETNATLDRRSKAKASR